MENDELAQHLESLKREDCYRVDSTLKQSSVETTQRVFFGGANGAESGPYIRKFIKQGVGLGLAYKRMYEAQRAGKRFKYLPDIIECYSRDETMVVVMECVSGQTLQEAVYENDPSLELVARVFPMLCDAVTELHSEFDPPIIHRDLKPSNILLTGQGLCLIDFGISREYREGADIDTTHFGTREFAPPEQYGFGQTGIYSDVYSLGMILFFCLTERIPDSQARNAGFFDPRIPDSVRQVICKATALDPHERFADAGELKAALVNALAKCGKAPTNGAGYERAAQSVGGRRAPRTAFVAGIAAVCLIAVCIFAFGVGGMHSADEADPYGSTDAAGVRDSTESSGSSGQVAGSDEPTVTEIAAGMEGPAAEKDGFDPATNFTVTVTGVEFQVPSYFKTRTSTSEDGKSSYYYAESGSSVAMLMTSEQAVDTIPAGGDFGKYKDEYVQGVLGSGEAFQEIVAQTDYELAGKSARIVTFRGEVAGVPITVKAAFFFEAESTAVGAIIFGQTDNVQFDYSYDFAKVVTSATPAK